METLVLVHLVLNEVVQTYIAFIMHTNLFAREVNGLQPNVNPPHLIAEGMGKRENLRNKKIPENSLDNLWQEMASNVTVNNCRRRDRRGKATFIPR